LETRFTIQAPQKEAAAMIRGKKPVIREVFKELLPELRSRAFTVSGVEAANVLQRTRDAVAGLAEGTAWAEAKQQIVDELDPYLGDAAENRADLLLRTHGFQAFQASNWRVAQEDDDTTHLQYLATEDDRVRDTHLALNGIVLPKIDPFWLDHYPPWEWGCRCRVRPMNPDLVDLEKEADKDRNPEDRNVLVGPVRKQLENGTLLRNGQRFDVSPPEGEDAFRWHPDNLRLPIEQLKQRYDPPVWAAFEKWARNYFLESGETVWKWLTEHGESRTSNFEH
jgi:SPP1 gp7 family putative phage head morphogenesis protein